MGVPDGFNLYNLVAGIWNALGGGLRQRLAWLTHAKFVLGVSGVVTDASGRVLLLQHRFWKGRRWGLPGGLACSGESLAETLRRELREETGLEIEPTRLLHARAGFRCRAEFVLLATCAEVTPAPRSPEILEARFWPLSELPENLLPSHRALLEAVRDGVAGPGLPLH